jgi:hypothetical protein
VLLVDRGIFLTEALGLQGPDPGMMMMTMDDDDDDDGEHGEHGGDGAEEETSGSEGGQLTRLSQRGGAAGGGPGCFRADGQQHRGGGVVRLFPLFEPGLSPRNICIYASR